MQGGLARKKRVGCNSYTIALGKGPFHQVGRLGTFARQRTQTGEDLIVKLVDDRAKFMPIHAQFGKEFFVEDLAQGTGWVLTGHHGARARDKRGQHHLGSYTGGHVRRKRLEIGRDEGIHVGVQQGVVQIEQ